MRDYLGDLVIYIVPYRRFILFAYPVFTWSLYCMHFIMLQLRFDGGAMAIIGGITAVLVATLRGSEVVSPW